MGKVKGDIIEDKYFYHMLNRIEFELIEENIQYALDQNTKRYFANCNMFISDVNKVICDIKKYVDEKANDKLTLNELKDILSTYNIEIN